MSLERRINRIADKMGYGIVEPLMVKKISDNLYKNTKEDISYTRKQLDDIDKDIQIIILDLMEDNEV